MLLFMLLLLGAAAAPAAQPDPPSVKPMGIYPLLLPGLLSSPAAAPKLLLWCQGVKLVGVVAPVEARTPPSAAAQTQTLPTAFLLRDGRCEPDGRGVSFGFLVPMKAWVYESVGRTPPAERMAWLLHRFQGTVEAGRLAGVLVQVDVNHPGLSFREAKVGVDASTAEQPAFEDEQAWLLGVTKDYALAQSEP